MPCPMGNAEPYGSTSLGSADAGQAGMHCGPGGQCGHPCTLQLHAEGARAAIVLGASSSLHHACVVRVVDMSHTNTAPAVVSGGMDSEVRSLEGIVSESRVWAPESRARGQSPDYRARHVVQNLESRSLRASEFRSQG